MHNFWRLRQHFVERISPRLREEIGLEMPDVFLLKHVAARPQSPSEVAALLRLPPHTISRRLDGLEKRALLTRRLAEGDARRRVLTVTPQGETALQEGLALLEDQVAELLGVLEPATLETFLGALERLAHPSPKETP